MSLNVTIKKRKEIIAKPITIYNRVIILGNDSEKILLIVKYTMWPPSSKGIGNKFKIDILNENKINILKTPENLSSISLSAFFTIPIGPASSLERVSFLKEFLIEL